MRDDAGSRRTILVSFSGIDGAGKSTQLETLALRVRQDGLRVLIVRFWDDVARLKGMRETSGHKIFGGDQGVGTPEAPINRRDKNVQSPWMTCVRLFLYMVDAVSLRLTVKRVLRRGYDLVIFDRYTYDELANLNLRNPLIRAYVRMLTMFVQRPHISFLLDADPVEARARKPEYPLEFLRLNRESYLRLANLLGGFTVMSPKPVQEIAAEVAAHAVRKLSYEIPERTEGQLAVRAASSIE
jgi:thymidylate kinase